MNKNLFDTVIREFRDETEGAACFFDEVRNDFFCANRLTRDQAERFAQIHDLVLNSWNPGKSCSEIECS